MNLPKTAEERQRTGNPGKRPISAPLAVITGSVEAVPDPPEHLGAEGTRRWVEVWSIADKWLVPTLDIALLVRYCEALDDRAALKAIVRKQGRMSEGSMRQPKLHPAISEIAAIDDRLVRWENELGFTPKGRRALHITHEKPKPVRAIDKYTS
jgi:P27 family predicted phage terminase small subunit